MNPSLLLGFCIALWITLAAMVMFFRTQEPFFNYLASAGLAVMVFTSLAMIFLSL